MTGEARTFDTSQHRSGRANREESRYDDRVKEFLQRSPPPAVVACVGRGDDYHGCVGRERRGFPASPMGSVDRRNDSTGRRLRVDHWVGMIVCCQDRAEVLSGRHRLVDTTRRMWGKLRGAVAFYAPSRDGSPTAPASAVVRTKRSSRDRAVIVRKSAAIRGVPVSLSAVMDTKPVPARVGGSSCGMLGHSRELQGSAPLPFVRSGVADASAPSPDA